MRPFVAKGFLLRGESIDHRGTQVNSAMRRTDGCSMARKSGIHIKKANRGKLRASTGTPKGKRIPVATLRKLKHSRSAATRRRATFALNARQWGKH